MLSKLHALACLSAASLSAFIAMASPTMAAAKEGQRTPNIVIFLADDMGYGDLGCHGEPHIKTTHIDKFASESVEFTNFHASPVCAPTRAPTHTRVHLTPPDFG